MKPIAIDPQGRPIPPSERWIRRTEANWPGSTGWTLSPDGMYRNSRLESVIAKRPPTPFELKTGQYAFSVDKAASISGERALVTKHKITTGMKAAIAVAGGALLWRLFRRGPEPERKAPDMDTLIGRLPSSEASRALRSARERAEYDVAREHAMRQYAPAPQYAPEEEEYEDEAHDEEEAWI